ncbi:MAG: ABC transporter ATP-binding protein, partial [Chloroflexota bacterium]
GAGKTTTMRMLLGLVKPTAGSIQVLGMELQHHLPAILERTGSVIENPTFYPYLSGRDNLKAVALIANASESLVPGILDLMDLTSAADKSFKSYSLGMKQRLAVGAAMLHSPDLLLLDEPANGLDPAGIVEMRDLMVRLKSEGRTVFISSHVLHEIEQICDRIAILNHGKIVVQGTVDQLLRGQNTIEIEVGQPEKAAEILGRLPFVKSVQRGGERLLVSASPDHAADINRALAEQGLYLSFMRPEEQSLEQYFLDVTGENQA